MIVEFGAFVIHHMLINSINGKEYLFIEGAEGSMHKFDVETCAEIEKLLETDQRHDIIGMDFIKRYNCIIIGD